MLTAIFLSDWMFDQETELDKEIHKSKCNY